MAYMSSKKVISKRRIVRVWLIRRFKIIDKLSLTWKPLVEDSTCDHSRSKALAIFTAPDVESTEQETFKEAMGCKAVKKEEDNANLRIYQVENLGLMVSKFTMKKAIMPLVSYSKLSLGEERIVKDDVHYSSVVGSIRRPRVITRPIFANYSSGIRSTMERLIRYVKGITKVGLWFEKAEIGSDGLSQEEKINAEEDQVDLGMNVLLKSKFKRRLDLLEVEDRC